MSVHVWEFSGSINETDFQESVLGASEFCKSTYPDFLESIQDGEETGCIPEFLKSTKAGEDVGELPQKQVRFRWSRQLPQKTGLFSETVWIAVPERRLSRILSVHKGNRLNNRFLRQFGV